MKNKITQIQFEKDLGVEITRFASWINKTEYPNVALESFIFKLVTELSTDHYNTMGILSEVLFNWRIASIDAMEHENEK